MKRFLTTFAVLILLAFSTTAHAEIPVVDWTRQLGTTGNDFGYGVSVDGSGNSYVTGYTYGGLDGNTSAGDTDLFLIKYDTHGTRLWTRQLGTSSCDDGRGIFVDTDGNAYVTGFTYGSLDGNTSAGGSDMLLTKYDTSGAKLWTRQLGSTNSDYGCDISVDTAGNSYVTGYTYGSLDGYASAGSIDILLTKYDTHGARLWIRQLGTGSPDFGYGMSVDGSGNAYVTGYTKGELDGNDSMGEEDMFLAKYDTHGNKLWIRQLGTANNDQGQGVSVDGNGNAYVTGYTTGSLDGNTSAGSSDIFLTKYDTQGIKLWTRQLGTSSFDYGWDVSVDAVGSAYVTGYTGGGLDGNPHMGGSNVFLAKYDTHGNKMWIQQLDSGSDDYGFDVAVDAGGTAYITGHTYGAFSGMTNAGGIDVFSAKISTIPEPAAITLLLCALASLTLMRRR